MRLSADDPGKAGQTLHLPNGLDFTYGDIVTLADFYELVDEPISMANDENEQRARFLAAFSLFALNPNTDEARKIVGTMHAEHKIVEDRVKQGEKPQVVYEQISNEMNSKYNCLTGGGCDPSTWFLQPGRYLELANNDYDHFGDHAWTAYKIGHQVAMEEAVVAHQTNDTKKLELAYAMNAYACHFLTDRFASGHIRTPRVELSDHVIPGTIGSILASYMHEEENSHGLHVHNLRGDHWVDYGDYWYFDEQLTQTQRQVITDVMQLSADEIFNAYQTGSHTVKDEALNYLPLPDEGPANANQDISPLFYWDASSQQLMRRSDVSNYYDKIWTDDWWGWSTLLALQQARGSLSIQNQVALANSEFAEKALKDGLITNKAIANDVAATLAERGHPKMKTH
jgi:hypothetical protein